MDLGDLVHEGGLLFLLWRDIWPIIKNFLTNEGGKALSDNVAKRTRLSAEGSRVLILAFFRAHPKLRNENAEGKNPLTELLRRQKLRQDLAERTYDPKESYRPVDEETMMTILAAVHETITGKKARVDFFYWLFAVLDDEMFDGFIKAIENDQILQWLKALVQIAADALDALKSTVEASRGWQALSKFVDHENLEQRDQKIAAGIQEMRNNYPWWMVRRDGQDAGRNPFKQILHWLSF